MRTTVLAAVLMLVLAAPGLCLAAEPRSIADVVTEAQETLNPLLEAGAERPAPGSAASKLDDRLTELRRELFSIGPEAVPYLLAEPSGEHRWEIRDWQIETVVRMGEAAVPALAEALRDPDPQVRANVYWCLEQMRTPAAKRALLAAADDPLSPLPGDLGERPFNFPATLTERAGGGEALLAILKLRWGVSTFSPTEAERAEMARPLLDLLAQCRDEKRGLEQQMHENADAQATIINGLAMISDPALVDHLTPALRDPDSQPWHAATSALMQMGPAVAPTMVELLSEGTPGVQSAALRVLKQVGVPDEAYPGVMALLDDPDDNVYFGAGGLLPRMRPERMVPVLLARFAEFSTMDSDYSRKVRNTLVRALGQLGDARAIPPLMEILTSGDEPVRLRAEALQSLSWLQAPELADAVEGLLSRPSTRMAGEPGNDWVLMRGNPAQLPLAKDRLVRLFVGVLQGDGDPQARNQAADALGRLGDPAAVPALMEMTRRYWDAEGPYEPGIANASAAALGKIGDRRAVPMLLELITTGKGMSDYSAEWAVLALGKIGDPAAQPVLSKLLAEAEPGGWQQRCLAVALGNLGDAEAIPILKECMKTSGHGDGGAGPLCPDYFQTEEAAQALARIGKPAVPVLLEALDWRHEHTADYACLALAEIGDHRAVGPISKLLDRRWPRTRHHAAVALGKLGDPSVIPLLQRATEDEDAWARIGAAEALWQLGEKSSVAVIEKALAEAPEDWQRAEAAAALGRMETGTEALRKALEDPAFEVRQAARQALEG